MDTYTFNDVYSKWETLRRLDKTQMELESFIRANYHHVYDEDLDFLGYELIDFDCEE